MGKLLAMGAALAITWAGAAQLFVSNGIQYVGLEEFAREHKLAYNNSYGTITLKGASDVLVLYVGSRQAEKNGQALELTAPLAAFADTVSAPLRDLEKAFGLQVTASGPQPVAPTARPSAPTANVSTPTRSTPPPTAARPPVKTATTINTQSPYYSVLQLKEASTAGSLFTQYGADFELPASSPPITTDSVYNVCAAWIREGLKSPSSAIFNRATVLVYTDAAWSVSGTVDSQNGYGAMLRGDYACWMQLRAGKLQVKSTFSTRR